MAKANRALLICAILTSVAAAVLWIDLVFVERFAHHRTTTGFFTLVSGWLWVQWRRGDGVN